VPDRPHRKVPLLLFLLLLSRLALAVGPLPVRNPRPVPAPAGLRAPLADELLEWCDGIDNDGDGSVDEDRGDRYAAPGGADEGNLCTDPGYPCLTISRAVRSACVGETVLVGAGLFVEEVVVDRPLTLSRWGAPPNPELRGSGGGDVLTILAPHVTVAGINVSGAPAHACVRLGDPAHPDIRHSRIENLDLSACAVGVLVDSTGAPAETDTQNRVVSVRIHGMQADGTPGSGSGVLGINGTGRLLVIGNLLEGNDGAGVRVLAPPAGKANDWILVIGNQLRGNGLDPLSDSHAAVEVSGASRLRVEGNWIQGQLGDGSGLEGVGALYDDVDGGEFACNRVEDNGIGVALAGSTRGITIVSNRFTANTLAAVDTAAGAETGTRARENLYTGNAVAVDHHGAAPLDARHSWWGGADGPGNLSDGVRGPVDVSSFIERATAPLLVRRPMSSGWAPPLAACYDLLQDALAAALPGQMVLVGEGTYSGHFALAKPLEIVGVEATEGCSPSVIDGTQSGGSHLPALSLQSVSGASLSWLTIRNAGAGTACGENSGDEAGLSLEDVSLSSFSDLCLASNGVSEVRLTGDSDGNRFARLTIDGTLRDAFGQDACGHRSREGILLAGSASCESGSSALAEGNAIVDSRIDGVSRGIALRLARATTIERSRLVPAVSPAWDGGTFAAAVEIGPSEETSLIDLEVDAALATEGIRVAGRAADDCASEINDARDAHLAGCRIANAPGAGLHLLGNTGDLGAPVGTTVRCSSFVANGKGIEVDAPVPSGTPANRAELSDFAGNAQGLVNHAAAPLDVAHNWWSAANGPSGAGPGSGDGILGAATFGPFLASSAFDDHDGDGVSDCAGDLDDADARIHPGPDLCDGFDNDQDGTVDEDPSVEICDGLDNDCNGVIDDVPSPGAVAGLEVSLQPGSVRIAWEGVAGTAVYDTIRGNLAVLESSGGDFTAAMSGCLANDTTAQETLDERSGPSAFYLVRAIACGASGSYDGSFVAGQSGARDPGIEEAAARCP